MSIEVAVVGSPFLDLTFERLPRLPRAGEEVVARALHVGPGGTGMQAVGAARLGLATALVAPIERRGTDGLLRAVLESEGVRVAGSQTPGEREEASSPRLEPGIPVTALLSAPEGVAMATALGRAEPHPDDVARLAPRAVVVSLGRLDLAPPGTTLYLMTGALELPHVDGATLERLAAARALLLNAGEAMTLTAAATQEGAALELARHAPTAVVTMGSDGAVAAEGTRCTKVEAPAVETVDATGAGDLFVAGYVWADLRGAPLADRLAWASLYAALSVRSPTAFAGAVDLKTLLAEGRARGLAAPPQLPAEQRRLVSDDGAGAGIE
jgi:sugar/nucleoside kinase (ribokinase family)